MAKAKHPASRKWRTLVYTGKDSNGKCVYESFTADTRKESEYQAAHSPLIKARPDDITILEAIGKYIDAKEAVLSPATIRGYRSLARTAYELIGREHLRGGLPVPQYRSGFPIFRSRTVLRQSAMPIPSFCPLPNCLHPTFT